MTEDLSGEDGEDEKAGESIDKQTACDNATRELLGLAHDLNNTLSVVLGSCDILEEETSDRDFRRRLVREIRVASERGAKLCRSVLHRPRSNVPCEGIAEVNEIIDDLDELLRFMLGDEIEYRTELAEQETSVSAHTHQIEQILINLVGNARDAMPVGGSLTISTKIVEKGRENPACISGYGKAQNVLLTVADTGLGIAPECCSNIFDPYYSTKDSEKGSGIGLYSVQGIVRQLGGSISVDSIRNKGTTFFILLPLKVNDL